MQGVFGPRTVVEAVFLVAVPVVAALALDAPWPATVGASAVAYLLVLAVEALLWREGRMRLRRAAGRGSAPEAAPRRAAAVRPAPPSAPEPEPAARPAPAAPSLEHVRVLRPEPLAAPEPEPVAAAPEPEPLAAPEPEPQRAPLAAVPAPPPEPQPEAVPVPAPEPQRAAVVPIGVGSSPRRWNVWDLERIAREHAGGDAVRDEERTFLLMYLREFADADGLLPVDFDALVRDSFGDLVGSR